MTSVGFVGLGNVGGKLAGSLLRSQFDLTVHDIDRSQAKSLVDAGATWAEDLRTIAGCDVIVTCLPSPTISAQVMEQPDGILAHLAADTIWAEMSTTDVQEVRRIGALVQAKGAHAIDCPVSGGCHRATTGNISIFAGCERPIFERMMPLLIAMGRRILHTGQLGSASILKVITNYLATANLVSLSEALSVAKIVGVDLNTTYEAIRISSGNSFVHETESQVILNGSRNINFTMDLVLKDIGLFQELADAHGVKLELSPLLIDIFKDGIDRYGGREWSPNIIKRLEEKFSISVETAGFPAAIVDTEAAESGYEILPKR